MSYLINTNVPVGSALNRLGSLIDVEINNPLSKDVLSYDPTTNTWVNDDAIGNIVSLTQAEYDELTQEEKMDSKKYYYITDDTITGAPVDDDDVSPTKVWSSQKVDGEIDTLNSALAEISDTEYAVTFNSNYFSSIQTKVVKIGKSLHINAVLLCSTVPPADPSVIGAIVKGANLAPLSKNYAAIVTAMRSTNDVYMYLKTDGNLTVLSAYNFSASTWYTFDVIVDLA